MVKVAVMKSSQKDADAIKKFGVDIKRILNQPCNLQVYGMLMYDAGVVLPHKIKPQGNQGHVFTFNDALLMISKLFEIELSLADRCRLHTIHSTFSFSIVCMMNYLSIAVI